MQEQPIEIEKIEAPGDITILRLHGPLLLGNFFSFQNMVRADKAKLLIIDLNDVPYIDSAGIGSLVGAHVSRDSSGRKLIVVGTSERLMGSLKVTKVDQLFTFAPDVAHAMVQATTH